MRSHLLFLLLFSVAVPASAQPLADLSGIAFIIDPGHSQNENVGIYGYSEAYKVLDVAFHLREFLRLSKADTVLMTRIDRIASVGITQRYTLANNLAHPNRWFHSIHSDASSMGSPTNSILILIDDKCASLTSRIYDPQHPESVPMANWMSELMSRAYRIPTRGVWGDKSFGTQFQTSYRCSANDPCGSSSVCGVGVLRGSVMPSTLSEGGFHTSPRQNLLNLNNESKRSEAKAIWMAMLGHFGVRRPPIRTLIGVITDVESGSPINGATVTTGGRTYKTNTYGDTFKPYAGTDTTLGNGYYYFENLPAGSQSVTVSSPGYDPVTFGTNVIDSFFTFRDVQLAKVVATSVERVGSEIPNSLVLHQNYPNPFNPETRITYELDREGFVSLTIVDLLGRTIRTLVALEQPAGRYAVAWDGRDEKSQSAASGMYLYKLQAGSSLLVKKMTLLK